MIGSLITTVTHEEIYNVPSSSSLVHTSGSLKLGRNFVMKRIFILLGIAYFFSFTHANSQSVTAQYINAIPQADQFPGSDACLKLQAAIAYATSSSSPEAHLVDATHFGPVATCTSLTNPFSGLSGAENICVLSGPRFGRSKHPGPSALLG